MKKTKFKELIREYIREVIKEEAEIPKAVGTAEKKVADLTKLVKQLPDELKAKLAKKLKAAQGDVSSYIDSLEPKKDGLKEAKALKSGQTVDDYDLTDNGYIKDNDVNDWVELFSDEGPFNGSKFVKIANSWLKQNRYPFQVSKATSDDDGETITWTIK